MGVGVGVRLVDEEEVIIGLWTVVGLVVVVYVVTGNPIGGEVFPRVGDPEELR